MNAAAGAVKPDGFMRGHRLADANRVEDVDFLVLAVLGDELPDRLADHLFRREAEEAFRSLVPAGDDAAQRLGDDRLLRGLDDRREARGRLLRNLALGDVDHDAVGFERHAIQPADDLATRQDPAGFRARNEQPELDFHAVAGGARLVMGLTPRAAIFGVDRIFQCGWRAVELAAVDLQQRQQLVGEGEAVGSDVEVPGGHAGGFKHHGSEPRRLAELALDADAGRDIDDGAADFGEAALLVERACTAVEHPELLSGLDVFSTIFDFEARLLNGQQLPGLFVLQPVLGENDHLPRRRRTGGRHPQDFCAIVGAQHEAGRAID